MSEVGKKSVVHANHLRSCYQPFLANVTKSVEYDEIERNDRLRWFQSMVNMMVAMVEQYDPSMIDNCLVLNGIRG